MIRITNNGEEEIKRISELRKTIYDGEIINSVKNIIKDVREKGDAALFEYTKKFDNYEINAESIEVTEEEIDLAYQKVDDKSYNALIRAINNIYSFQYKLYKKALKTTYLNKTGFTLRAVERAGIYVPGGKAAYPSTVMMCALPALAAGVGEIIMVTPAGKELIPLTLVAARECGVDRIFKVGGAQAIAAMAYGTESIPKADIITGPGNIFVTLAKKEVFGQVGIDMLAGPSEVLVIADSTADPVYVASDMLSQAEHDQMAASYLITDSESLANQVQKEIDLQLEKLERKDIAKEAIENNSVIILTDSLFSATVISNKIAPEHLEIMTKKPKMLLPFINNAGAIFLGKYSPEPLGDYFAGPDHVLPTSGSARFSSGLSAETYLKRMNLINYNQTQFKKAAQDIITLSMNEGLTAHSNSVKKRLEK